jgi:hypothetical protein
VILGVGTSNAYTAGLDRPIQCVSPPATDGHNQRSSNDGGFASKLSENQVGFGGLHLWRRAL